MNNVKQRRQTISDKYLTPEIINRLIEKVYANVNDAYDIKQKEVVNILVPLKISNATIALIINTVIPTAKATAGSVATLIRNIREREAIFNELIKELEM